MPQIWVFSFPLVTLEFSIHNFFETRMLLDIFDAKLPYKLSYFVPLCLLNKMAAKTMKRSISHSRCYGRIKLSQTQERTQRI